jgi:regulator of replication initiation timing
MNEIEILKTEIAGLKNTIRVLIEQIAELKNENEQLKKDVIAAAIPKKKIMPAQIPLTDSTVAKLSAGLKGILHPKTIMRKYTTVAIQLITLYNEGPCSAVELCKASGLSYQGFAHQSMSLRKAELFNHPVRRKYSLTDKSKEILNKVFGE